MGGVDDLWDAKGFVAGVYRGARSFRIDETGFLTGIVYRQRWLPGVNTAVCKRHETQIMYYPAGYTYGGPVTVLPEDHGMDRCRHGFYAFAENSNDYHQAGMVSGVIEGWGEEVMLGTRGFRCLKARIVALSVTEVRITDRARTELVFANYPLVPFFETFEDMVREFPPDRGEE